KLRTVIWDFVDEPIPQALLADLRGLGPNLASGSLRDRLETLLTPPRTDATARRPGGARPEPGVRTPPRPSRDAAHARRDRRDRSPRGRPPALGHVPRTRSGAPVPVAGRVRGRSVRVSRGWSFIRCAAGCRCPRSSD